MNSKLKRKKLGLLELGGAENHIDPHLALEDSSPPLLIEQRPP
jgi:hypothetical protein